ncbi:hypothetical protein GW17_00024226 [Ensete ventricosum]|nr:hypothetical protein GW17_00024226 [Ensete ventricosum]
MQCTGPEQCRVRRCPRRWGTRTTTGQASELCRQRHVGIHGAVMVGETWRAVIKWVFLIVLTSLYFCTEMRAMVARKNAHERLHVKRPWIHMRLGTSSSRSQLTSSQFLSCHMTKLVEPRLLAPPLSASPPLTLLPPSC